MRCLNLIDSSNNAEEDLHLINYSILREIKCERGSRNFDDMYLSDILLLIDISKCQDQHQIIFFVLLDLGRMKKPQINEYDRYMLDNYCTVFESFCRYFHCLYCECLHLFTNPLVTVSPWVNIFALRWIFGRGSSRPCCRRLQTSSWNNIRPRTWGCC